MIKPHYFTFLPILLLLLTTSCDSNNSGDSADDDISKITETIYVRDTVFITPEVAESDSIDEVEVLHSHCVPIRMNFFYQGVDNPIAISVPGVAPENLQIEMTNGSISKVEGDSYVVRVTSGNSAIISVSVKNEKGNVQLVNKYEFRVKPIPDPKVYFAGLTVGDEKIEKRKLTAAQGVIAKMENFDFDIMFTVTSFKLTMIVGGMPIEKVARGNRLTGDMKTMIKKAKPGSKIYLEDIRARGPDGTIRKLGGLAFKVI